LEILESNSHHSSRSDEKYGRKIQMENHRPEEFDEVKKKLNEQFRKPPR